MGQITINDALKQAIEHHRAGRISQAEALYRQILAHYPYHPDALHLLGVIALDGGRFDLAIDLLRRAISVQPAIPDFHNNLGNALHGTGELDQAIAAYNQALRLEPNPDTYNNLGNALRDKGMIDQAMDACREAIRLKPDYAEAWNNLGNALYDKGQLDDAIADFRKAITLKADYCEAYGNLGNVLCEKGQFDEAIDACRQALRLKPNFATAHYNVGNALKAKGRLDEAIASYRKAITLNPGWTRPHVRLGILFAHQGRFEEARLAFQRAVQCDPNDADAYNGLARALAELQHFDEADEALGHAVALKPDSKDTHETRAIILLRRGHGAEAVECFRYTLKTAPESVSAWMNLAHALRQIGHFSEAADCCRQVIARFPDAVQVYNLLADIHTASDVAEIDRLTVAINDPKTSLGDRAALGFALGRMLDEADRFDEAFIHFAQANALTLQMRSAAGEQYNSQQFSRRTDEKIAAFTADFFMHARDWGDPSELPVFIVGMPRSGTTLVEQIAATHPNVFGAGELNDIGNIMTALGFAPSQRDLLKDAARRQLMRLRSLGGSALRVIDKMPANVEQLGLIAMLFPSARVILCRRDPRDTCLSCFFQQFSSGNLFSFDLVQCGLHHVHTDRLIAHWQKVLPLQMLPVQYEELVADLEGQSRRIINFLGLPWNAACLDFHRTERTVQTASGWQVRQPIYTRSVGRWRNYRRHLGPLLESLGPNIS